ncbi:MAG: ribosomal-protein-alanine N-acetyltransferase [Desulfobulbus propionicus]|nr:MAG: ribosomal-protein-alanine N-acetyltransferase [Desulfobulbus propionicus]
MNIRPFSHNDAAAASAIDKESMESAWTIAMIHEEQKQPGRIHLAAEKSGAVAGYIFFRIVDREAELLRLGVANRFKRSGIGGSLLRQGILCLVEKGVTSCFLEVRPSNYTARKLYTGENFYICGRRPMYYSSPAEDALVMVKKITDHSPFSSLYDHHCPHTLV